MIEVYVDPAFTGLSNGVEAVWNSAAYSHRGVVIGTTGFATIAAGITAVDAGGTVWLAAGDHEAPASITKNVVVRGRSAVIEQTDVLAVTGATVRFRDVAFTVTSGTLAAQVRTGSVGLAGFMHCTFNGAAVLAAEANGVGSAVAVCGCTIAAGVTGEKPVGSRNGGAWGHFAATTMPAGGPTGRPGNTIRHKMRIDAPAESRDLAKGQRLTWVPVDSVYGSYEPLRGEENVEARIAGADVTHRIELPGGLTITPAFRVVIRERAFNLGPALQTDNRDNRMMFTAREEAG